MPHLPPSLVAWCEARGTGWRARRARGGDTATAIELRWPDGARAFVKLQPATDAPALAAEAEGLHTLAATGVVRIPAVVGSGEDATASWLALEWLELHPSGEPADLGRALAQIHRHIGPGWGWPRPTWLGRVPLGGGLHPDPVTAFRALRLEPLAAALRAAGHWRRPLPELWERISARLPRWLGPLDAPVLVHGDLWGGNHAWDPEGRPVLFDPSPGWWFPEYDLGFSRVFGGFPQAFYAAHATAAPAPAPYAAERELLGALVLLAVHVVMFGSPYWRRTLAVAERLGR